MDIRFLGAADTVTGSRQWVRLGGQSVLLDCGLFQGYKLFRERNWAPLDLPVQALDAVVLSHAHLDHGGWLPRLVAQGFRGPIHCSPATRELAEVLLLDSARLQEEDARRANRGGYSRHQPARPLYTRRDVERTLQQFKPVRMDQPVPLGGGVWLRMRPAGHLLGACTVQLGLCTPGGRAAVFYSGDVGRTGDLMMPPPSDPAEAEVLLVESTYGNRLHPPQAVEAELAERIRETLRQGGSVLLPTFAVGRAQALLLVLQRLKAAGELPRTLPVLLDSPMAIEATELYRRHHRLLKPPARELLGLLDGVQVLATPAQSRRAIGPRKPSVILSASGMATGGRVLDHLAAMAPDPRHLVLFPGFQVGGTRGALLVEGAREIKIRGQLVPVRARIGSLEGFSGHADADGLMAWLGRLPRPPAMTYVVHGEPTAADALRRRIQQELGWTVQVPQHGATVTHPDPAA